MLFSEITKVQFIKTIVAVSGYSKHKMCYVPEDHSLNEQASTGVIFICISKKAVINDYFH